MNLVLNKKLKYKLLTFDELVINLDRLSRFKNPEEKYNRVFLDILTKCLIFPSYSKNELLDLNSKVLSVYVEKIWNDTVKTLFRSTQNNSNANKALKLLSLYSFKNISKDTHTLINTKLNISLILQSLDSSTIKKNLLFLKSINEKFPSSTKFDNNDVIQYSRDNNLLFPIEKVIIVEGITEEILLPVFAKELNSNFDSNGILVLGAGGKSKSPALYSKLKDSLSIPVVLLFDSDAKEICTSLNSIISKNDKIIILEKGEFEDLLSLNLIKRALNNEYCLSEPIIKSELLISSKMCVNLENFYKTRNLGEFKKAKFAKLISNSIKYKTDITDDIKMLINQIF